MKMAKNVLNKKALTTSISTATCITIFISKKQKHICTIGLTNYCPYITIFVIKKAKTAKNILDKKAIIISISAAAIALLFLLAKKQKHIYIIGLTSCCLYITIFTIRKAKTVKDILDKKIFLLIYLLLPLHYNIYEQKRENIYV